MTLKVLKDGGNAVDAGIVGSLVQAAVELFTAGDANTGEYTALPIREGARWLTEFEDVIEIEIE